MNKKKYKLIDNEWYKWSDKAIDYKEGVYKGEDGTSVPNKIGAWVKMVKINNKWY